jgi:hypothetical protein
MKGTANAAADAISRRSDYMEPIPLPKVALFKKEEDGHLQLEKA